MISIAAEGPKEVQAAGFLERLSIRNRQTYARREPFALPTLVT